MTTPALGLADTKLEVVRGVLDARITGLESVIALLQLMLNERYATQTKALDAAFLAQQTAMRTALEAAEKAVQTALVSAEKAVGKAEVAAEKRFESVNEFRAQLNDQAATFPTRPEVEVRFASLTEKVDALAARQNISGAITQGSDATRDIQRVNIGQIINWLVLAVAVAALLWGRIH